MENEEHSTTVTVLSHAHIARVGNSYVPLKITYQELDAVVVDGSTAVIGSDAESTVRIVRPGISRRHAVVSQSPSGWIIEDAGSRNGSYRFGLRFDRVEISGPETVYLGHPTDGEELTLTPVDAGSASSASDAPVVETFVLPESPPVKTGATASTGTAAGKTVPKTKTPVGSSTATSSAKDATPPVSTTAPPPAAMTPDPSAARSRAQRTPKEVDLAELTNALRDQINAVRGLTWSVWAMIAVTAALAVMTLFVGILGS